MKTQDSPRGTMSRAISVQLHFPAAKIIRFTIELDFETYQVWPGPPEVQHVFRQFYPIGKIDLRPGISPSVYCGALGMPGDCFRRRLCDDVPEPLCTGGTAYGGWKGLAEQKAKEVRTIQCSIWFCIAYCYFPQSKTFFISNAAGPVGTCVKFF